MIYSVVDYNEKFAVWNNAEGYFLRSKESSSVIAFADKAKAENMCAFFEEQYGLIVEASKYWIVKSKSSIHRIYIP
jgi:hypothetical protein